MCFLPFGWQSQSISTKSATSQNSKRYVQCKRNISNLLSSQAGLRADGAGESALPAEESPWRLRALGRERELWEFYKKIASISSWEREKKPHSTCRDLNPLTPTWVTTCTWRDFPAPKRWSREMGKRWTLCGLSTLPFYRSSWKGGPMTWGAPPCVLFRPSTRCSSRPKSC